jgi:hypothetical protein
MSMCATPIYTHACIHNNNNHTLSLKRNDSIKITQELAHFLIATVCSVFNVLPEDLANPRTRYHRYRISARLTRLL